VLSPKAAGMIAIGKLASADPGALAPKGGASAAAMEDGSGGYDVVFNYNSGSEPGHHTFKTLAEARSFAREYSKGVYSLQDGTLTSIWIVRLGKAAKAPAAGGAAAASRPLGWLSEKYEVGKNGGPGTISTGKGDKGGVSYGMFQLASRTGTAQKFADRFYPQEFKGKKPGTVEFNAAWRQLAEKDPAGFAAKQRQFIKETHYDPVVRNLRKDVGLDANARSSAVQNFLWSVSVQFGTKGGTRLVEQALKQAAGKGSVSSLSEEQILRAINAERGREDDKGNLVRFKSSSKAVQEGVRKRYGNELRDALELLRQEEAGAGPSANTPLP